MPLLRRILAKLPLLVTSRRALKPCYVPVARWPKPAAPSSRVGFTLIELLVTITIIGIMAGMVLFAMFSAQESAKKSKTEALIAKLHSIIMQKYDSYRTRRVPVYTGPEMWLDLNGNGSVDPGEFVGWFAVPSTYPTQYVARTPGSPPAPMPPVLAAKLRLDAIRELMRLELPDRWSDIIDPPNTVIDPWFDANLNGMVDTGDAYCNQASQMLSALPQSMAVPARTNAFYRALANAIYKKTRSYPPALGPANTTSIYSAVSAISVQYQDAELLYLIVTTGLSDELTARELFGDGNVGDKDGNGLMEFWDAWGNPIHFVRWPAGFASEVMGTLGVVSAANTSSSTSNPMFTVTGALSETEGAYNGKTIVFTPRSDAQIDATTHAATRPDGSDELRGYSAVIGNYSVATSPPTVTCASPLLDATGTAVTPKMGDTFVIVDHDPFDGKNVYGWKYYTPLGAWRASIPTQQQPTYATYPLIFSAGPDGIPDIITDTNTGPGALGPGYAAFSTGSNGVSRNNNPFVSPVGVAPDRLVPTTVKGQRLVGTPWDVNQDGEDNSKDNIHNHLIGAR